MRNEMKWNEQSEPVQKSEQSEIQIANGAKLVCAFEIPLSKIISIGIQVTKRTHWAMRWRLLFAHFQFRQTISQFCVCRCSNGIQMEAIFQTTN